MAVTLTGDGEITYASFPIIKTETTDDGDLIVYGKATDGSVDSDMQIVRPEFAFRAIKHWKDTGANVRVQHNPQRDPAGVGIGVEFDGDATWVKSLVVEPVAQKLVAKGVLTAYSVGIARPTIERDATGKARGGIITDGTIVEISLVDRPANKSCGIQLVKSADGDTAELVNDVFGDKDMIAKMISGDVIKGAGDMDFSPDSVPDFKFTPNDLAKIVRDKIIEEHYSDLAIKAVIEAEEEVLGKAGLEKRNVNTAERRSLASSGHALPDGSYPIANAGDLHNAAHLARTGHGNAEAAKRLIARRARELGVTNPLEGDENKEAVPETADVEVPDAIKDQNGQAGPRVPPKIPNSGTPGEPEESPCPDSAMDESCKSEEAVKAAMPKKPKKGKAGKKKKLPPWLNKPADDGDDCKMEHVHTEKCHTDPKTASGASDAADMNPAPVGELLESPAFASTKSEDALMRFKTLGIDADMGTLHDMSCPAFHPDEVAKFYPYADFSQLDDHLWQQKALAAAAGKSLDQALEAQQAWQSAVILKGADPADLYNYRLSLYKAFRDANPGPTSYPTPGAISAQRFCRPNLGGGSGHSKDSPGYGAPNSAPQVATSAPNAHSFDRPPLSAGHQSPSPSFMKGGFEYPAEQGVPTRITYAEIEKEKARRALSMMHDHLIHMFPSVCPITDQDAYRVEQPGHPIPEVAGLGKAETVEPEAVLGDIHKYIAKLEKQVRAGVLTEDQARDKLSKRTARKYAEDLAKQVKKGLTSIEEVRRALGLEPEAVTKAATPDSADFLDSVHHVAIQRDSADKGITPDVMKTMMSEILEPFQVKVTALGEQNANYQKALEERDALIKSLQEEQQKNNQRWEDLANRPDPGTASFAGLALNPSVVRQPAAVVKQAEVAEKAQQMIVRQLERTARVSENPAEREAAWTALMKIQGNI